MTDHRPQPETSRLGSRLWTWALWLRQKHPYLDYAVQLCSYYHQRFQERLKKTGQVMPAPAPIPLTIPKEYRVEIGNPDRITILLVGCGGTGSFTAHILAQLASWAAQVGIQMRLYFIDPDKVQEKNLVRQNFCYAEVGYHKAVTLAWRYTAAFGIHITPVMTKFSEQLLESYRYGDNATQHGTLTIIIGAVDNYQARRDIADAVTKWLIRQQGSFQPELHKLWWIDGGNERWSGQVIAGNSLEKVPLLSPLGYCTGVPLPHIQAPEILQAKQRPELEENLSCADLTLLGEQSAVINRTIASLIGVYLYRLLQSRDLKIMTTFVDLEAGSARSIPIDHGHLVKPTLPERPFRLVPVRHGQPAETPTVVPDDHQCPRCGMPTIEGQDDYRGVLVRVHFCTSCDWREERCPQCGHGLEETYLEIEAGPEEEQAERVPGLACGHCTWRQPIPAEYRTVGEPQP